MKLLQPSNTVKYDVKSSDTLTGIALRYNTTPTELSRLNHLASSLIYPGQTLFVPQDEGSPTSAEHRIPLQTATTPQPIVKEKSQSFSYTPKSPVKIISPRHSSTLSPDQSLEDLLQRQDSEEEISRRYLRIKSKYITDGQGVVSGVLIVTPQTIMFNPSVSDHLVMDRGREAYLVRLPLKALAALTVFEEIAAMVTDDVTKKFTPKNYEQYRPFSPPPRPGVIVCQNTGEEFAIPESFTPSPIQNGVDTKQTLLSIAEQQLNEMKLNTNNTNSETAASVGSDSDAYESATTSLDGEEPSDVKLSEIENSDQGISTMTTGSETVMNISNSNDTLTPSPLDDIGALQPTPLSKAVASAVSEKKEEIDFSDSVQSSTPKHTYDSNAATKQQQQQQPVSGDGFSQTKELHLDLNTAHTSSSTTSAVRVDKMATVARVMQTLDGSKDSGISELTRSHSTNESSMDRRDLTRSSLSDEAKKWLGKHSVSMDNMQTTTTASLDIEPEHVSEFKDPLIYISVKVSKRYWCPTIAKHNAIMGIPPNRDQKRRQHWFAIPREKIDQFYGFVIHWLPDFPSPGIRTPSSTESENNIDNEEGINIVDDTFGNSPASAFGWEKLSREDAASMKLRQDSLHSSSSKVSLRSLDDDPETSGESELLSKDQLKYLVRSLPSVTVGRCMELVYSTILHGISLKTLYRNFEIYECPTLLVVRDENHKTFGAFLSDIPALSDGFYGTGECLLFSFASDKKVNTYKWSGENSFFIKGSKTSLTVGGGLGVLGLWLDEDLYHGRTHSCSTFNNEILSQNEDFICTGLEAWAFV